MDMSQQQLEGIIFRRETKRSSLGNICSKQPLLIALEILKCKNHRSMFGALELYNMY